MYNADIIANTIVNFNIVNNVSHSFPVRIEIQCAFPMLSIYTADRGLTIKTLFFGEREVPNGDSTKS